MVGYDPTVEDCDEEDCEEEEEEELLIVVIVEVVIVEFWFIVCCCWWVNLVNLVCGVVALYIPLCISICFSFRILNLACSYCWFTSVVCSRSRRWCLLCSSASAASLCCRCCCCCCCCSVNVCKRFSPMYCFGAFILNNSSVSFLSRLLFFLFTHEGCCCEFWLDCCSLMIIRCCSPSSVAYKWMCVWQMRVLMPCCVNRLIRILILPSTTVHIKEYCKYYEWSNMVQSSDIISVCCSTSSPCLFIVSCWFHNGWLGSSALAGKDARIVADCV